MPCGEAPFGAELHLALQDFQGDAEVEPALGLFRLADHVALKGREVVRQPGHGRGKAAGQPQLVGHELHRHRQHRGDQDLLANGVQQVLRRHVLLHPLAQGLEEIGLLDVLFPAEHPLLIAVRRRGLVGGLFMVRGDGAWCSFQDQDTTWGGELFLGKLLPAKAKM